MPRVVFATLLTSALADYKCPGSSASLHASMKVTSTTSASCADVQAEIESRAQGKSGWVDPHNGGVYSLLSSSAGEINTQRTTNPATSVGGKVYTDKQTFILTDESSGCKIESCSESQGSSFSDFSTNYCDQVNLYCGSQDGCTSVSNDFTHSEGSHKGSLGAGHDFSQCVVKKQMELQVDSEADDYQCPGSSASLHASMKVTSTTSASCADVQAEIESRAQGKNGWVDPHNAGVYSLLSSSAGIVNTQRTTNPATSVGGKVYTDKQTFVLADSGSGCTISSCSESQGSSFSDFSTNYCDQVNLYCGSQDGCSAVGKDFEHTETSHKGSLGAGHDFSQCIVKSLVELEAEAQAGGYQCPGSGSFLHASMKVTAQAQASCSDVQAEIEARAQGKNGWTDPHNGGVYSVLSSSNGMINTQRTTNPATSVGGKVYTDKQTFTLSDSDGGCKIEACSESQGTSVGDFSTNYCDLRNLYCGSSDGCTTVDKDFSHSEASHSGSIGAGHDAGACIVTKTMTV